MDTKKRTCSVRGCQRPHAAKDLCELHYRRKLEKRPLNAPIPAPSVCIKSTNLRSFRDLVYMEHYIVDPRTRCFLWLGGTQNLGYPRTTINHKQHYVLRILFNLTDSKIDVRHLCHRPRCVNPDHVTTGTRRDNIQDMMHAGRQWHQKKTHCKRGHLFDETNTYITRTGGRDCKTCHRDRARQRYEKRGNFQAQKTHCKNGHEFSPENTYIRANGKHRICKTCARIYDHKRNRATL